MSGKNEDPQTVSDDDLDPVSGGGRTIATRRGSDTVGMLQPGVGDLKPAPPSPVPIPYPNIPNTKD